MSESFLPLHRRFFSRLTLFWALSRTPHGLLDMATPGLCALIWLGRLPPLDIIIWGLVTTFAGYTAVYALNDVMDFRIDREKVKQALGDDPAGYLDAALGRHPIARGFLSLRAGYVWAAAWSLLALVGAYQLNPVCVLLFLGGCILEVVYCLLFRISHHRTIVSGIVKTSGGLAAVLAVDPAPSLPLLLILFAWLFFWEIGGQNIPADWTDVKQDRRLRARTVPVRLGTRRSSLLVIVCLVLSVALSLVLMARSALNFNRVHLALILASGIFLLLWPALQLYRRQARQAAMALFNRASFYPLTLLAVVVIRLAV